MAMLLSPLSHLRAQVDESGSGASDLWEMLYGPLTDPDGDDDGDGFTNVEEYLAGTDPNDPEDYPRIRGVDTPAVDQFRKRFPTVPGIHYQIMASPDLETWFQVGPAVIGEGGEAEVLLGLDSSSATGNAVLSRWNNLSGGGLDLVKQRAAAGVPGDEERLVTRLDFPQSQPDENNFGQWIRGWILAPGDGEYVFWIASDDHSELWLSSDAERANMQPIASVSGWTGYQEWGKYASQRSAPVSLQAGTYYAFEIFHREWSGGDHLSVAWTRPGRPLEERELLAGEALSTVGVSMAEVLAEHGRLFFKLEVGHVDSDGDGLTDFEEALLGLNPHRARSRPRVPDLEEALRILQEVNTVTLGVSRPRAYEAEGQAAEFVVFRAGNVYPVTVNYSVSGTAAPGVRYEALRGSVEIPGGARTVRIPVVPLWDGVTAAPETVVLTLLPGEGYELGSPLSAEVRIDDALDVLYTAWLSPPDGIVSSGTGRALLRRAGNALGSGLELRYSGLNGPQTGAELYVSDDGGLTGPVVLDLGAGMGPARSWDFAAAGGLSREEILDALEAERIWLRVRSAAEPAGELRGLLRPGVLPAPPPPTVPEAPSASAEAGEVARFLTQAGFGPRPAELDVAEAFDFDAWITAQQALPPSYHLPYVQARRAELLARGDSDGWQTPRQEAFWQHALTAPDQLRQRMAFALSQILVISQFGALDTSHEGSTLYYDMLVEHAFGNYRDLLEAVTLSPMMGVYLSMMRNQKPDPETGHEPDENYAREIMQLFTVGLNRLHMDGSIMLDAEGLPVPAYTQDDTVALAHIFTGWGPHYDAADPPRWNNGNIAPPADWFRWGWDEMRPMSFYPAFHDTEDRTLLGGALISGALDGEARLRAALDALFQHPNLPPFLARNLIQRFVTSNPSPGYIRRVAEVFTDNGQGVRGDLGATLRAILLDPEARHPAHRDSLSAGKADEPVLRMARALRGLELQPVTGHDRYYLNFAYGLPEQAPLLSPSVFNFFQPVYSHPGPISREGLLSPEFQIFSETTAVRQANQLYGMLYWGIWTAEQDAMGDNLVLRLDFTPWIALLNTPGLTPLQAQALLIDRLDALFLHGRMSPALRQDIVDAFAALPGWYDYSESRQLGRVRLALYLVFSSPECFVLR